VFVRYKDPAFRWCTFFLQLDIQPFFLELFYIDMHYKIDAEPRGLPSRNRWKQSRDICMKFELFCSCYAIVIEIKEQLGSLSTDWTSPHQCTWRMDGKWSGNSFLLGSSSWANSSGWCTDGC
jgi:hypothetical protein